MHHGVNSVLIKKLCSTLILTIFSEILAYYMYKNVKMKMFLRQNSKITLVYRFFPYFPLFGFSKKSFRRCTSYTDALIRKCKCCEAIVRIQTFPKKHVVEAIAARKFLVSGQIYKQIFTYDFRSGRKFWSFSCDGVCSENTGVQNFDLMKNKFKAYCVCEDQTSKMNVRINLFSAPVGFTKIVSNYVKKFFAIGESFFKQNYMQLLNRFFF